jgi:hypothetical protein
MPPLFAHPVYAVFAFLLCLAPIPVFGQDVASRAPAPQRPAALIPLYASMVTLQVLDLHSTLAGTRTGVAREANPILASAAGSPFVLVAIKTGTTAAIVAANERLWKEHRITSIVVMAAVNAAYAMVAAHNYKVAGRR